MLERTCALPVAVVCLAGTFAMPSDVVGQSVPEWRLSAETRIGEEHPFTQILAILPRPDGSVIVADNRNREIDLFRRDGTHVNSIGRTGEGPGEYVSVRSVGLLGDTLWVVHGGEPLSSLFATDGTFLSSVRRDVSVLMTALTPDGALGTAPRGPDTLPWNEPVPLLVVTRSGQTLDTLAWVRTGNDYFWLGPRPDGSYRIGPQRFQDQNIVVVAMDAPTFFVIDRSVATGPTGAAFRITALRSNGDTLWDRAYAYTPKRVAKARIDSMLETVHSRVSRS